ncbi:TPA: hypothetical protein RPW20_000719 [Campylobacter fetus subsp. venerealis]|nr:hypothetical protein [Campylobacter fetus subsp. venerealis]HDX6324074.1 hypothetical protein [Campylobacter fetus subsp. venerealis]
MKKLIPTIIFTNLFLFGGTFSETLSDGQLGFYAQIDTAVQTNANTAIAQINTMRKSIIQNIVENDELKRDYLTKIKKLGTEELLYNYEIDFEINRYLNLQNIEIQTEPVKDKK